LPSLPGAPGGLPGLPDGGLPGLPDSGFQALPDSGGLPGLPDGEGGLPGLPDSGLPTLPDSGLPGLPDAGGGSGLAAAPSDEAPYAIAFAAPPPSVNAKLSPRQRRLLRQLYSGSPQISRIFRDKTPSLNGSAKAQLADLAALLKALPDLKIGIEIHVDMPGPPTRAQELSDKQAATVQKEMNKRFPFSKGRVFFRGMGHRQPLSKDISPRARAQNNRVELHRVE
jgi:outer membrane protein OmpA-like peptidoglycan-associated protein